jgi:DNA-binding CsgD family transcriptional regulator
MTFSTITSGESFESSSDDAVKFFGECCEIAEKVRNAIEQRTPVISTIESIQDAVYIKACDGTLLVNNSTFEKRFADCVMPTGRQSSAFLNDSILPFSQNSDAMIIEGADQMMFSHPGRDLEGQLVCFRTFKASLLGFGHPRKAILGISRLLSVDPDDRAVRLMPLSQSWIKFCTLRDRDREIAAATARGERTKVIAERMSCSEKTVENSRNTVMKTLSLDSPAELIKLMVRLQDSGFSDFGL